MNSLCQKIDSVARKLYDNGYDIVRVSNGHIETTKKDAAVIVVRGSDIEGIGRLFKSSRNAKITVEQVKYKYAPELKYVGVYVVAR